MCPFHQASSRHAANFRLNQTTAERTFWFAVRDRRLAGLKFRRQVSLGPYVVDFLCVAAGLVVELDGGQHTEEGDAERTAYITKAGFRVVRFWNRDVLTNLTGVLEVLLVEVAKPPL